MEMPHELQVVIPYKTLVELLRASDELAKMEQHIIRQDKQIQGLQCQFTDLLTVFGDLRRSVDNLDRRDDRPF